jgi:hypothetical protein
MLSHAQASIVAINSHLFSNNKVSFVFSRDATVACTCVCDIVCQLCILLGVRARGYFDSIRIQAFGNSLLR